MRVVALLSMVGQVPGSGTMSGVVKVTRTVSWSPTWVGTPLITEVNPVLPETGATSSTR